MAQKSTDPKYLFRIALVGADGTITPYDDVHYRNAAYANADISKFEEEDKADGCYVPDAYIVERRTSADTDDWHKFVPKPKVRHNDHAYMFRLPRELYDAFTAKAKSMGISGNAALKMLMLEWVEK